jgi:hypothetical protein
MSATVASLLSRILDHLLAPTDLLAASRTRALRELLAHPPEAGKKEEN